MERYILAALVSFAVSAASGPILIPLLHRLKAGQSIREVGPSWHAGKSGTPTMGGIMFILSTLIATLVLYWNDPMALSVMICAVLFGVIGFADDFIKVVLKRNLGLTSLQKFSAQAALTVGYLLFLWKMEWLPTALKIPFGGEVDFSVWVIPFAAFVLLGTVNSVNLTDGLDGLAGTTSLIVSVFFAYVTYRLGEGGVTGVMIAVAAGCLGFLIYNHYPAKVFMGDTGSLYLGGALGAAAIAVGAEWFLVIAGAVFLLETLSVILQVGYFKLTHGKRIFKMTPIHHHFEMCNMKETKVVLLFSVFTIVCCMIAFFGI